MFYRQPMLHRTNFPDTEILSGWLPKPCSFSSISIDSSQGLYLHQPMHQVPIPLNNVEQITVCCYEPELFLKRACRLPFPHLPKSIHIGSSHLSFQDLWPKGKLLRHLVFADEQ